ncbi:uncharacterized protein BO80DRAFT_444070 [Aspergillus ibericus CBS 121593]|uniref:Heterokaryon incompatibility domain-containing protein n=1 Tax=Aspergillus ibericus CBS 121593 TaxID=1448316 RepID=A0A395H2G7_9EURO|nr:hypothetical protein BO80DRAFT_444070 [Aspergillus ibericus CBS 121593]RAL01810.1 hypothetical protein BO80DRAFT_444070 [Aspergillus ibericus CBS 121593]
MLRVLQEVGLARSTLIVCGPVRLSGYTFVLGLQDQPDLEGLVTSIVPPIEGSIFRSAYRAHSPGTVPFGELIDRYRTREATWSHDKVYALLGMTSDNPDTPALKPNYDLSWNKAFQQVIEYIIPSVVSVTTWPNREAAVIRTRGHILAMIDATKKHNSTIKRAIKSRQARKLMRLLRDHRGSTLLITEVIQAVVRGYWPEGLIKCFIDYKGQHLITEDMFSGVADADLCYEMIQLLLKQLNESVPKTEAILATVARIKRYEGDRIRSLIPINGLIRALLHHRDLL